MKTSIDELNVHLFEAIEMLKNNNDKRASGNEKINVETASAIAELGKVIVDGYKIKVQALNILAKANNPNAVKEVIRQSGIAQDNLKLINQADGN